MIFPVPSNDTPLIVRAVCKAVAVEALPVKAPANVVAVIVPPFVILFVARFNAPPIVKPVKVPTEVSDEPVTVAFSAAPVNVPAAAETVIFEVPSNDTPLIVRAVCKAVAVAAFPVVDPDEPVTLPEIGFVTVRFVSVPTEVSDEVVTVAFNVVPVKVPAAAATVIFEVPSKETPLMVRAVCKAVAVAAFPVVEPDDPETFPVTFPTRLANVPTPAEEIDHCPSVMETSAAA